MEAPARSGVRAIEKLYERQQRAERQATKTEQTNKKGSGGGPLPGVPHTGEETYLYLRQEVGKL